MLKNLALAALIAFPTSSFAQGLSLSIRERFTIPVVQIDANTFEVIEADGAGGTQLWCAAGLFTRKGLGQRGGDIYIQTARGPSQTTPGRKGVVFTTQQVDGATRSYSQGVGTAGRALTMTHANALCRSGIGRGVRVQLGDGTLLRS
jgi:hypothetical protein